MVNTVLILKQRQPLLILSCVQYDFLPSCHNQLQQILNISTDGALKYLRVFKKLLKKKKEKNICLKKELFLPGVKATFQNDSIKLSLKSTNLYHF